MKSIRKWFAELKAEKGAMNIVAILIMGIGMVFLAVGFIMFPIVTTATDALLAYVYSPYTSITAANFTGFTAVVGITPLLVLLGFVAAAVFSMYLGVKLGKGGGSTQLDLGGMLLLGLSTVFIAIALIILPVAIDGVSSIMTHKDSETQADIVDTAVGVTIGNYTLTEILFNNNISEVTSLSSNITEINLQANNYTLGKLYVTGLTANTTRTITTSYNFADLLDDYTGVYPLLLVTPLLILIGFIASAVLTGFFGFKRLTGGGM